MKEIYTDGFLEGMRYSGHLLHDVPNEDLSLTNECKNYISKTYRENHFLTYETSSRKRYSFIKRLVEDCDRLYEENQELKSRLDKLTKGVDNNDRVINYLV